MNDNKLKLILILTTLLLSLALSLQTKASEVLGTDEIPTESRTKKKSTPVFKKDLGQPTKISAQNLDIPFKKNSWSFSQGSDYEYQDFENRKTLLLDGGTEANLKEFKNGTIEVDIHANQKRSFAGISFRKQDDTMEEVYMRMHKSNQSDAVQYTPIFSWESNWQLYPEHQAAAGILQSAWNTLKIRVMGTLAKVYLNEKEVLLIDKLKIDNGTGGISLFALFGNQFSNFKVSHGEVLEISKIAQKVTNNGNLITEWKLSKAFPFEPKNFESGLRTENLGFNAAKTEPSGLLPISKFIEKPSKNGFENNQEDYVVAQLEINSENSQDKKFSFDYSDRCIVYLNGKEIFRGNNAFRSKGPQFQGHLGIDGNTLSLPLQKGKNILDIVVIEKANGWGLTGKFNETSGLRF
ncbi:family 16 glycoside hydrolase [Flagellimonas marina]|uniref:Family 16 glycoside hydrolase n=1 Tax=Flagellimonas marina TaxID=1775168 RepID=A0ABV8PI65_9FLAO